MNLWKRLMCYCRRRSPWIFHLNSGSCNGCDIEIVASLTPRYDAEQLGVRLEGSPRHADILCVTGPVTKNAVCAIKTVYGQVCGPKAVVAIGSCPATTNVFIDSRTLDGPLDKHIPVDVFVPGCPPRPDAIVQGIAKAAEILAERGNKQPIRCAGRRSRRDRGAPMNITTALARLLIFPGILFAVPAAWFFLWVERKAVALMQGRIGPPFMQPFYDFVKLLGKGTPQRSGVAGALMRAWPLIAVSTAAGAVGLLPVLPASGGFEGDLILLLALLEVPSICIIAAGFSSRSLFGEIGSAREAVLSVSYNVVFLLAIVSIAASQHTFRLEALGADAGVTAALAGNPGDSHLPACEAAPESLLAAQRRAGDLLRPDGRVRRTGTGHVGTFARAGVGGCHGPCGNARCAAHHALVARCDRLRRALVRHRAAALRACRGHGAPGDRHNGSLLLAMHSHLRGSGRLVRSLHEA